MPSPSVLFQPTRSQERDFGRCCRLCAQGSFNPRARKSATKSTFSRVCVISRFNPRARKSATKQSKCWCNRKYRFQPTRSQERDAGGEQATSIESSCVSTHALARARLNTISPKKQSAKFQPTRSQERDTGGTSRNWALAGFNPRARKSATPVYYSYRHVLRSFNPRARKSATC